VLATRPPQEITPVLNLSARQRIANTAATFGRRYGEVSHRARLCGVPRQAVYRDAPRVVRAVEGDADRRQRQALAAEVARLKAQVAALQEQLRHAVVFDADRQARFAGTAQAEGVSLPVARRLLRVALQEKTPSVAALGRLSRAAAVRAGALLAALDPASRPRVEQAAADEIFLGRKACLMVVEPHSLCWLAGRLAERTGDAWAAELRRLPNLKQLTRDAGNALGNGRAQVNAPRQAAGLPAIADQEDHFHALREGGRALRRMRGRVSRLVARAERAQQEVGRRGRAGQPTQGFAKAAVKAWRAAEAACDAWSAAGHAWQEVAGALALFTPEGRLNTRARAEALLRAAEPRLAGPAWAKARRALRRPQLLTFLDEAQARLAALPVAAEVREAAVRVEGLRRRPEALSGDGPRAGALRGVLLAAALAVARSGEAGAEALARVGRVPGGLWRASSLVECLNSVARMQQARHRRVTAGLLDLKRLYWNCRAFRTGRRRGQTPYALLGLTLPTTDWWALLKWPPEQLRQQLSAPDLAA
jgi:hypothetical protein